LDNLGQWNGIDFTKTVFYLGSYKSLQIPQSIDRAQIIVVARQADLTDIDLSGCNLAHIDIFNMNFTNANLQNSKLPDEYEITGIFSGTILPDGTIGNGNAIARKNRDSPWRAI
jgi:uncharacterized protein YjbI with pentapeptide repeats